MVLMKQVLHSTFVWQGPEAAKHYRHDEVPKCARIGWDVLNLIVAFSAGSASSRDRAGHPVEWLADHFAGIFSCFFANAAIFSNSSGPPKNS